MILFVLAKNLFAPLGYRETHATHTAYTLSKPESYHVPFERLRWPINIRWQHKELFAGFFLQVGWRPQVMWRPQKS